ncbi:FAD-dependent monooxygenase [Staphylococcus sp. SQ8-PEA]|uniref:FAD-dependent monooxygenase n=1 Tax=Staphylococcus marylandisciuri TaxID=2981529 RepID=A0ABT2QN84_9STAP|nr:FAD-dependent monooxygenase [Staphylococcus marylandisciuri]MCU5745433.1 FAD-dependent monooxygenase [Staphylococcus marylandisciuri]
MNIKEIDKVAIIGGGPGGLMLGLLLQQRDIPFTIYEKGAQNVNTDRGGSLDIHEESGQLAIHRANLTEEFKSLVRFEGEDTKVVAPDGQVTYKEVVDANEEGGRPEIDRGELCDLIMKHIDQRNIRYQYQFERMESAADSKKIVHFTNGDSITADLVIGVDGAFSKVRPYLTSHDIEYTGISMVELNIDRAQEDYPQLYEYNQRGKMMALGGDRALLAQLNGDGRIKVYVSFRTDATQLDYYKSLSLAELQDQLLNDFADWAPELQDYIKCAGEEVYYRRIYKLPIGLTWKSDQRLTLLGDAAHLMSPFAGEGVNTALYDAFLFDQAIEHNTRIEDVIHEYEEAMYLSSSKSAQESQDNLEFMFSDHAASKMGDFFKSDLE